MSKVSREKKEKAAKAAAKQPKAEAAEAAEVAAKPKHHSTIPNEGKCCTCKSYRRVNGRTQPCHKTGKYTPRKATCPDYKLH